MTASAIQCVNRLVEEYKSFLGTAYRFLDPKLRKQFEDHLAQNEVVVRGPYVTLARDFLAGETLADLVRRGVADPELARANWPFGDRPLFAHQARALEIGRAGRPFLVTTGTGSGKTEAFLLPVIDGILRRKRAGIRGLQAVLLYPMNALANDQLERMRRLLRGSGLDVSFGMYTGESDSTSQRLREAPAETERTTRGAMRLNPPDILLTNYKQLEFLLVRKQDRVMFTPALRWLVLDELHSYRGALATEIACLIRRLKARARVEPGAFVGIGTSATIASGANALETLAEYASVLLGEDVLTTDVLVEQHVDPPRPTNVFEPPPPVFDAKTIISLDVANADAVVAFVERLSGRTCRALGPAAERIRPAFEGNAVVLAIEEVMRQPMPLDAAAELVRAALPSRRHLSKADIRAEIEAYLLVGSIGDDASPPRLRPKLHTFLHGVYDVWLCTNPTCRTLVPQGGEKCSKCGSAALPAALCRTCGQDYLKVAFKDGQDPTPLGTAEYFSNMLTGFFTPKIHDLTDEEDPDEPESDENDSKDALERIHLCTTCIRIVDRGDRRCPKCGGQPTPYRLHRGPLHRCHACGDVNTRADIVTPLRTGTASTVSALTTHHLDLLSPEDRRILVFADNRQDVAHQAGYTADKHRVFALRHSIAHLVAQQDGRGIHLSQLPQQLFDVFKSLKIITGKPTQPQRETWLHALEYEAATEFTRFTRQRASLENLGLVAVDYEFLDGLAASAKFQAAARGAAVSVERAILLVRAILDVMRRNRAVAYEFFQEFIDTTKRRYRELEAEPYCVRFPTKDQGAKGFALDRPEHIRRARSGSILGILRENPRGNAPAIQRLATRVIGDSELSVAFIRAVVPLLIEEEILQVAPKFPIPAKERTRSLEILQINPGIIRLIATKQGWRCSACQTWYAFDIGSCAMGRCTKGSLAPISIDGSNYYVRLYRERAPQRLAIEEHSAQVSADDRAKRETEFKEGKLDALVCTPTLELGVDIGPLVTVLLRGAPPTPANYVQRVGRAGRRLRIGFVSTFCAGGAHDRHAFEDPSWLVRGEFEPSRLRLDNARIVHRHIRSFVLEHIEAQLPVLMGELLDDLRTPTRWMPEKIAALLAETSSRKESLVEHASQLFANDRERGRTTFFGPEECHTVVEDLPKLLERTIESWWQRVRQLEREHRDFATVGSTRQDAKKASARQRAYREITQDHDRAYALNYLATQGVLPSYQFPTDTFSLDPGIQDTQTLFRPAVIALEEFAPGNFVYANGHKLRSIRVLFAGGPGRGEGAWAGRSDAETSGRLRSFQFCEACGEAHEAGRNACARCATPLGIAQECIFVSAFEAEEALKIGSDEESRQKKYFERREHLLSEEATQCQLFPYPLAPIEHRRLARFLVTNWGVKEKGKELRRFSICPECGRHRPAEPAPTKSKKASDKGENNDKEVGAWDNFHAKFCSGRPSDVILGYEYASDCAVLGVMAPDDERDRGGSNQSPTLVTLAEALVLGASEVLQLETGEIGAFARRTVVGESTAEIVFYETVPGGAGYVEELARRLPAVAEAARRRLYDHDCSGACYLCLKRYQNQYRHAFFDKEAVRDLLLNLSTLDPVTPADSASGAATAKLRADLPARRAEIEEAGRLPGTPGPESPIERLLLEAIRRRAELPEPVAQHPIERGGRLVTLPDFAYTEERIAIFCDGYAFHGNKDTLELDSKKRNWLQSPEGGNWTVLTYWGRAITRSADACAFEIERVWRAKRRLSDP